MQDQELTGWFINGEKPARDGVYQQMCGFGKTLGYQKFENDAWYAWQPTPEEASKTDDRIGYSRDKWRGLSFNPNPKPRGNPKVTRYVVRSFDRQKLFASFESIDVARNYAEQMKEPVVRITKIRFRSPEASK